MGVGGTAGIRGGLGGGGGAQPDWGGRGGGEAGIISDYRNVSISI